MHDPFQLKIGKPVDIEWETGKVLDFDQSSTESRFTRDQIESERTQTNFRAYFWVIGVLLTTLLFRLSYLQISQYKYYLNLAEGNRLRVQKLLAPRGIIYDRYQKELVRNEPSFELVLTPLDLPRDENVRKVEISEIANFFGVDEEKIWKLIDDADQNSFNPLTVKLSVEKERAVVFATKESNYPGFSVQSNPQRLYLDGEKFAHVIGYTGKLDAPDYESLKNAGYIYNDLIGKEGLELSYEKYLRGELGQKLVEVDARGVIKNTFQQEQAGAGNSLNLTIDADLQRVLYDSLQKHMTTSKAKKAAAVAIDPNNGNVLALVSLPSYDNNMFSKGITNEEYQTVLSDPNLPMFNRATSGTYPPGSTIKPFLSAAALQEGVINESTKIFDGGKIVIPNVYNPGISYTFHGWKASGLGSMDVYSAIAMSSDIFFYTVGGGQENLKFNGLGANRISDYLKKFYFGKVTGIDLPTEKSGTIPNPEWKDQYFTSATDKKWYLGDTYNMSIGQGFVLVTPLQLTLATAAIANGGTVYKPWLVQSVTNKDGKIVLQNKPEVLNSGFIDQKYLDIIQKGMRQTVTAGTARVLSDLPIAIAGKTGTSQFDGSNPSRTHAWFTSYAPFDNPKIVLTVLVEAGGEGSSTAVPVARDVYDWYSKNRKE